jgi:hypothetical protein
MGIALFGLRGCESRPLVIEMSVAIDKKERGLWQKKMEEDPEQMNGLVYSPDFRSTYCLYSG